MKWKALKVVSLAVLLSVAAACSSGEETATEEETNTNEEVANEETNEESTSEEAVDYSGTYVGYSWRGEAGGTTLEDAEQKIETTLTLDADGVITDAKMDFLRLTDDGEWVMRNDGSANVSVDFSVTPTLTTPNNDSQDYAAGDSMFDIETVDMMAFYAAEVNADGTAALAIVEPYTRHQFEYKLDSDFDFSTPMKDMTIGSGLAVPTTRVSSSNMTKITDWEEHDGKNILDFTVFGNVLTDRGVFEGLDENSTMQEFLERTGVTFEDGVPTEMALTYGRTGIGGWEGNLTSIAQYLIGQNAKEVTSLIDWDNSRYANGIDEENFFGNFSSADAPSGATRSAQISFGDGMSGATRSAQISFGDGMSGATVRISRESTSYQRALVEAGIIDEEDVIKGRF
ncbi:hypothetical protein BKP35_07705 [Anaerobacillus arseniciselenatis]|uniref:Uncharacterized protein n=1 Tax=Anaerobacillus arseniciselenatis TaxID=85682 RepID=A0A1S2LNH4_9BACI|nr:hypothetical protein [Anaerobacillus arseniciselenatis]OIJ14078.1 hypothetical protein BKP35_07705 [Anaerobacillus arseniciselenatis]